MAARNLKPNLVVLYTTCIPNYWFFASDPAKQIQMQDGDEDMIYNQITSELYQVAISFRLS